MCLFQIYYKAGSLMFSIGWFSIRPGPEGLKAVILGLLRGLWVVGKLKYFILKFYIFLNNNFFINDLVC